MPLTAAEKQRSYRERMKKNPQKYAAYVDKEKQRWSERRLDGRLKFIGDKSVREQRRTRLQWKKQQSDCRKRMKEQIRNIRPTTLSSPKQDHKAVGMDDAVSIEDAVRLDGVKSVKLEDVLTVETEKAVGIRDAVRMEYTVRIEDAVTMEDAFELDCVKSVKFEDVKDDVSSAAVYDHNISVTKRASYNESAGMTKVTIRLFFFILLARSGVGRQEKEGGPTFFRDHDYSKGTWRSKKLARFAKKILFPPFLKP